MQKVSRMLFLAILFLPYSALANDWQPSGSNVVFSGGRVGIGTVSPRYSLEAYGNMGIIGDNPALFIEDISTPGQAWRIRNQNSTFRIYSDYYNPALSILEENSYVGIGTTSPQYRLHVKGGVRIDGPETPYPDNRVLTIVTEGESPQFKDQVMIASGINTPYGVAFAGKGHHRGGIYAENTGGYASSRGNIGIWARNLGNIFLEAKSVGVGTKTPTEKLEVAGNIKLSGNILSDGDICIGNCAGIEAMSALSADEAEEESIEEPSFLIEDSVEEAIPEEEEEIMTPEEEFLSPPEEERRVLPSQPVSVPEETKTSTPETAEKPEDTTNEPSETGLKSEEESPAEAVEEVTEEAMKEEAKNEIPEAEEKRAEVETPEKNEEAESPESSEGAESSTSE